MSDPLTNLVRMKGSRRPPELGDVFAMKLPTAQYLFGRVVAVEPDPAPMPSAYLIYVYDVLSDSDEPPWQQLTPDALLLPPNFINRMPWTKGYFRHIGGKPLEPEDLVDQYCFWSAARKRHLDENMRPLDDHDGHTGRCGEWALGSYRSLDDEVSDALGIPRVPA